MTGDGSMVNRNVSFRHAGDPRSGPDLSLVLLFKAITRNTTFGKPFETIGVFKRIDYI